MKIILKAVQLFIFLTPSIVSAGVVDDWLGQLESSAGPTAYNSGTRGYLSAGSIRASVPNNTEYLASFSPPRLDSGACGVDLFLGGFSYMDIQYLGDKIEKMWQNADTVALSMAMSALSKTLDEKGLDFTEITDFLNGLQFNECEITKMGVTAVVDGGKWAYDKLYADEAKAQSGEAGLTENTQDFKTSAAASDGQPKAEVDISANLMACEQPIQDILSGSGSVIHRLTANHGIASHENIIRGILGDIYIDHTGAGNAPQTSALPPCDDNNINSLDDFIYGLAKERSRPASLQVNTSGTCTDSLSSGGLLGHSTTMLTDLSVKLKTPSATHDYTSDLSKYINAAPLPVFKIIKDANDIGVEVEVINELAHTISYISAYAMVNDMQRNVTAAFARLNATLSAASTNATNKATADATSTVETGCDLAPYVGVITQIGELNEKLAHATYGLHDQFLAKITEIQGLDAITSKYQKMGKEPNVNYSGGQK
jgi:conjugative transfer pilus assembly protein TraH